MTRGDYSKIINLGVDLDGVTANFSKAFSKVANKLFGDRCPILQKDSVIEHWDWYNWYPITKEEQELIWDDIIETENFWTTLELIDKQDFDEFRLIFNNDPLVNVYFVTARQSTKGKTVVQQSARWLEMMGWRHPQVIEIFEKGPALKALNIHHFVDDRAENIIDALHYSPARCYVMEAKHNHKLEEYMLKQHFNGIMESVQRRYCRINNLREFAQKTTQII